MGNIQALKSAWSERRLDDAWAVYQRLVESGETGAELHYLGARIARERGDLHRAWVVIQRAMDAGPSGELLGQVRFGYGAIARELGDPHLAVQEFRSFLSEMPVLYPHLESVWAGPAQWNLGLALRRARHMPEAAAAYREACRHFRREGMPTFLCMALQNLAWVECIGGNVAAADDALQESRGHCGTDELQWHERIGEAFLAAVNGERTRALDLCKTISGADAPVPVLVRSHACWLAGRVAMQLGQMDGAMALAQQGLDLAVQDRTSSNFAFHDVSELIREIRMQRVPRHPTGS